MLQQNIVLHGQMTVQAGRVKPCLLLEADWRFFVGLSRLTCRWERKHGKANAIGKQWGEVIAAVAALGRGALSPTGGLWKGSR